MYVYKKLDITLNELLIRSHARVTMIQWFSNFAKSQIIEIVEISPPHSDDP